jgi:PPE-repeat protein
MTSFEDAAAFPPQVNFYQLVAGDMGASAAAAALALQALSMAMSTELATLGANTASTAAIGWQGPGGEAMTLSAAQMMDVYGMAIAWLEAGSAAGTQIVEAHQTAAQGMIPGPVCDENRDTYGALALTNFMGMNFPAMGALDYAYFGEHWPHNAMAMSIYQAVVAEAMTILATPPPMSPTAADPAGALAGVAQAAAQGAGQSALQAGGQTLTTAADAPAAAGGASSPMSSAMQGMSSIIQTPMQMISSLPQMLGQIPQMAGQVMQTGMGLLGPLTSSLGQGVPGDAATALTGSLTPGASGGAGLGGGGGGGFGLSGAAPVTSTFTRPASSFNTPAAPKLPGGWGGTTGAPEPVASSGTSGMGGGGGLYGAQGAGMGRDGEKGASKTPARTMQLTGRAADGRGE